ncbi:MAG TPA: penicillin-insensitive murein endopeptidase [Polyangiales bacterium]|nr:penicillin-insensitive murein endopeptidase [Polyangiales bacterium]
MSNGQSRLVPWLCALAATSMVWLSGSFGTSASAELPMTADPILREAQHAESHAEPSDEDLEKIARMPRRIAPSDLEPAPSVSVGYPNRGLLRFGARINDDGNMRVKDGSLDARYGTGELVRMIERAAEEVAFRYPRSQLTVGDLSRPGGGRFRPHVSHQSGRDVDLGFYMLDRKSNPINHHLFVRLNNQGMGKQWGTLYKFDAARNWALIESLLSHPTTDVQHVFVSNSVKRLLMRQAVREHANPEVLMRARRVITQPSHGAPHRSHFHVRIYCADDDRPMCKDRPPFYAWHQRAEEAPAVSALEPNDS